MHTLVTDDDPAFRKALKGCGLDRQLCVVHMRRTVRRRLQRMRKGKDKILPTPEDAAVLQGVVRLVQELPLWGGQLLLVCCEWAHQGVVRLSPPVLALVEHVMDRWNDLVRCVRDPSVPPARTGRGLVWPLQAPGAAGPRPEDAAGGTGLPAPAGWKPGLKPAGKPGPCQRSRACPPEPFSTKVKQCRKISSVMGNLQRTAPNLARIMQQPSSLDLSVELLRNKIRRSPALMVPTLTCCRIFGCLGIPPWTPCHNGPAHPWCWEPCSREKPNPIASGPSRPMVCASQPATLPISTTSTSTSPARCLGLSAVA